MRPLVPDSLHQLRPYVPGKPIAETRRELGLDRVIKLASNENPLGPSPAARRAVQRAAARLELYPDDAAYDLRGRLASEHGVGPERLVLGNGSTELIRLAAQAFLRPGERVVAAWPSFVEYRLASQVVGREISEVPLRSLRYDVPALARAAARPDVKLLFIAQPNNPTGTYVPRGELEWLLDTVPEDVVVVLDEAYNHYAEADDYASGLDDLGRRQRLLVLRTFSKCHGLASLRVGYGIGTEPVSQFLNRARPPFNVNDVAQAAALASLDDREHLERSRQLNRTGMASLTAAFIERGFQVTPSAANFLLVDCGVDGQVAFQRLLERGVIVRPLAPYGLDTHLRITIGTEEQNAVLLEAIDAVLSQRTIEIFPSHDPGQTPPDRQPQANTTVEETPARARIAAGS